MHDENSRIETVYSQSYFHVNCLMGVIWDAPPTHIGKWRIEKMPYRKWGHFSGERVEQARNFTRYLQLLHLLHPSTEVTNIFDWAFCATVFVLLNLELETAEKPMRSFHLHFSLINVTVHTSPSSFLYNFNLILVQFPNPNTETGIPPTLFG